MASSWYLGRQPRSPLYSPTSPSYSPAPRYYSPSSPYYAPAWQYSPERGAYSPELRRWYDVDEIRNGAGSEGPDDGDRDEGSGRDDDVHSDGSDGGNNGVEGEQRNDEDGEIEEEPGAGGGQEDGDGDHDEEEQQSESEELSDESDREIHGEDEQHAEDEEDEEEDEDEDDDAYELQQGDSERGEEFIIGGSDVGNAVEDGHQAHQEQGEEEEPPQPPHHEGGGGGIPAVDGDLAQAAPPRGPLRPSSMPRSASEGPVIGDITVERTDALDCGICYLALKPPIFLCDVGHVVCSPCRDKLATAAGGSRCHVCRAPTAFRRCHAMEQLVDSIRVACPHAAHGCADRPAYHDRERHARECAHVPCRCPGSACTFSAPMVALADHLAAAHGWPCNAEAEAGRSLGVDLRDGFNFVTAVRGSVRYLILLNVASMAFGRAVSMVCLRPQASVSAALATASSSAAPEKRKAATCELELKYSRYPARHYPRGHYQTSRSEVASTDGSNGLPDPNASFQFFIPKYVAGSESDVAAFHVTAGVYIDS